MARQQRAADKLQKRLQKKTGDEPEAGESNTDIATDEEFPQPKGLDFHDF